MAKNVLFWEIPALSDKNARQVNGKTKIAFGDAAW
jgi:hypothetical protein